jgi:hypothetical protein
MVELANLINLNWTTEPSQDIPAVASGIYTTIIGDRYIGATFTSSISGYEDQSIFFSADNPISTDYGTSYLSTTVRSNNTDIFSLHFGASYTTIRTGIILKTDQRPIRCVREP